MKIKIAAALMVMTAAGMSMATPSNAAVGVSFDFGNVALGYSDGYYDNGHRWHRWAHRGDGDRWRNEHGDKYHGWRHNDRHHH